LEIIKLSHRNKNNKMVNPMSNIYII